MRGDMQPTLPMWISTARSSARCAHMWTLQQALLIKRLAQPCPGYNSINHISIVIITRSSMHLQPPTTTHHGPEWPPCFTLTTPSSNSIVMLSYCLPPPGQERAPTSVAYAENQSMFLDSLANDAAWLGRYAVSREGQVIPWEVVQQMIQDTHPYEVFMVGGAAHCTPGRLRV